MACKAITSPISPFPNSATINTTDEETDQGRLLFDHKTQLIQGNISSLIYLKEIRSYKSGFGTLAYRRMMKAGLDLEGDVSLETTAAFNAHIFHFKMGMKPQEKKIKALPIFLGLESYVPFTTASKIFHSVMSKVKADQALTSDEEKKLFVFKKILTLQNDQVNEELAESVSNATLIEKQEQVLDQTVSSLWYEVLSPLLKIISKTLPSQRPYTHAVGPIYCVMSDHGIARWREDLKGEKPFIPFRDFEHLSSDLFPWQQNLVREVLASAREKGVKI